MRVFPGTIMPPRLLRAAVVILLMLDAAADEIVACLAGLEPRRTCAGSPPPRDCLRAHVAPGTPVARVQSCFQCCFDHWARSISVEGAPLPLMLPAVAPIRDELLVGEKNHEDEFRKQTKVLRRYKPLTFSTWLDQFVEDVTFGYSPGDAHKNELQPLVRKLAERPFHKVFITTTDCRLPRPLMYGPAELTDNILTQHNVSAWYATNPDVPFRIHDFPLGMQPNALGLFLGKKPMLPWDQPERERPMLLACCCMAMHKKVRRKKMEALVRNGFECEKDSQLPQLEYFMMMRRAKFVFSPRGHGFTNFRDWEALAMGAIPLVDAATDDPAEWASTSYAELPALPVTDWSAITPGYLEEVWARWAEARRNQTGADTAWPRRWPGGDMRRLYPPFWLGKIIDDIESAGRSRTG